MTPRGAIAENETIALLRGVFARADRFDDLLTAAKEAQSLIDRAMGDTDPPDPDHPLLLACQILTDAICKAEGKP